MRRLILFRHAKSDWPQGVADHDRPLASRGRAQAPVMGAYLASEMLVPDLAIVSTALRAQETWRLASAAFREAAPQRDDKRVFAAPAERLLAIAREAPPETRVLVMVGHNPGFHEAAARFVGHGDRYAFARMRAKFPTSALAVLDFAVDGWGDIDWRAGRLDRFVTPKSLGGEDAD
ncbi:MAG: histidine phosphatase family protein [Beijerinckiaceae bacterium]